MNKKIILFLMFFLALSPVLGYNIYFDNSTTIKSYGTNSTITFSINSTADYLLVTSNNIYLINVTTPLRFCSEINFSDTNGILDSANFCPGTPGGGGGGGGAIPEEPIRNITCSIQSIESMGICLNNLGNVVWTDYPNAGILILTMMIYIVILLLVLNRDKLPYVKESKMLFKILFLGLVLFVAAIVFIWMFSGCEVNQFGDLKSCVNNFGNSIWPGHSYTGILIISFLFLVLIILLFINRKKRRKNAKKI